MTISVSFSKEIKTKKINCEYAAIDSLSLVYPQKDLYKKSSTAKVTLKGSDKYMALERRWWFWVEPVFGDGTYVSSERSRPHETHVLLSTNKSQTEHILMLPLFVGDWRAFLHGGDKGIELGVHGGEKGSAKPTDQAIMLVSKGKDPIALMQASMAYLAEMMPSFRLCNEKRLPAFVDYFGWCTWNAYYQEVSEQKVLKGLQTFKDSGVQPRFMILDDGWQDINAAGHMNTFGTNKRFPKGLAPLIEKAKDNFNVELFGVWHALQGYWGGVNPRGPLAKAYNVIAKQGLKPCNMEEQEIGLVDQKDVFRFYQDFHGHLRTQGVDMVKIDSQSGMQELCRGGVPYVSTMSAYQKAIQASTQTHFEGNLLHCMSNTQDVAYNMSASTAWRNSDDFYPNQPHSHSSHMVINAYNAVWSHTFACPDWDMFMSGHYTGAYHAAARAISGGPVYISDKPGDHDPNIIKRLCLSDGRALRSAGPALPLSKRMYEDPKNGNQLLFVKNTNGPAVVVGAFHCQFEGKTIIDSFTVRDLGLRGKSFALWYARAESFSVIPSSKNIPVSLNQLEAELVHVVPIDNGVAALGLIDKDNASAAICSQGWDIDGSYRVQLKDGGKAGVYCQRKPSRVINDQGKSLKFTFSKDGLLVVKLSSKTEPLIAIYW